MTRAAEIRVCQFPKPPQSSQKLSKTCVPELIIMSNNPVPLLLSSYHQKLLYEIDKSVRCTMSYDPDKLNLVPHRWYVARASVICYIN